MKVVITIKADMDNRYSFDYTKGYLMARIENFLDFSDCVFSYEDINIESSPDEG